MSPAARSPELRCREGVELVTDYLEGALSPASRERVERHLATCSDCRTFLEQMRATIRAVGLLGRERAAGPRGPRLLRAFRRWRRD